jgi:hypothetical protein
VTEDNDVDDDNNKNKKTRNQRSTKGSHIGLCPHTLESANVKVHNTFHGRSNITSSTNRKHRTAVALFTLETWFVLGI